METMRDVLFRIFLPILFRFRPRFALKQMERTTNAAGVLNGSAILQDYVRVVCEDATGSTADNQPVKQLFGRFDSPRQLIVSVCPDVNNECGFMRPCNDVRQLRYFFSDTCQYSGDGNSHGVHDFSGFHQLLVCWSRSKQLDQRKLTVELGSQSAHFDRVEALNPDIVLARAVSILLQQPKQFLCRIESLFPMVSWLLDFDVQASVDPG